MYRTTKHRDIVDDPVIRYKPVESLPGIGPVNGRKLRDGGYFTADQLLTQYLTLKRNEHRFTVWLSMASGTSAHQSAQCFSGLNEWYNTWGRDASLPKKTIKPPPNERGSMTNRMLLEQKMLQFNSNADEDRLRSLFSNQTVSLVDIPGASKSSSRPSFYLGRLNKSHCNITENGLNYSASDRDDPIKKLSSPTSKSVNFKECVEFNAHPPPMRSPIPDLSKRPKSPILKSRSLTPEIGRRTKNPNGLSLQIKGKVGNRRIEVNRKGSSMNNLNMTGKSKNNNKNETLKAKSIENLSRSNTFTKSKPNIQVSKKFNTNPTEKLVCTCNFPYTEIEIWSSPIINVSKKQTSKKLREEIAEKIIEKTAEKLVCTCDISYPEVEMCNSSETDSFKASKNIEKYFDEKLTEKKQLKNSNTSNSTPLKVKQVCSESKTESETSWNNNESKEINDEKVVEVKIVNEQQTTIHYDNSNEGDESDISSEYALTKNKLKITTINETCEKSLLLDSRDLENVKIEDVCDGSDLETCNELRNLVEDLQELQTSQSTAASSSTQLEKSKSTSSEISHRETTNFDNSNEDSGLDVTPKSNCDFSKYSSGIQTTDDECSTLFENIDSRSEADTDRTYEINDTTDTESGFHFISSNSAAKLERVEEVENAEDHQSEEQESDMNDQCEDELKRTNIKLFCDMLSNDLSILPMNRFRKLKLKILEMVYADIDKYDEKQ